MIRGTTPKLEFTIPFDTSILAEAWITLSQNGIEVLTKELSDCQVGAKTLSFRLTQEETLKLQHGYKTEIQIRVRTLEGEALASCIIAVGTDRILKDGVI